MAGLTFLIAHISHADDGRTDNQEPINQEIATLEPIINHAQPELLSHDALTPKNRTNTGTNTKSCRRYAHRR